jgi:hypothetical protein
MSREERLRKQIVRYVCGRGPGPRVVSAPRCDIRREDCRAFQCHWSHQDRLHMRFGILASCRSSASRRSHLRTSSGQRIIPQQKRSATAVRSSRRTGVLANHVGPMNAGNRSQSIIACDRPVAATIRVFPRSAVQIWGDLYLLSFISTALLASLRGRRNALRATQSHRCDCKS